MNFLNNLIDIALCAGNMMSIKENHTQPKTREEREKQKKRRRNISDIRNTAFLIKRFIR